VERIRNLSGRSGELRARARDVEHATLHLHRHSSVALCPSSALDVHASNALRQRQKTLAGREHRDDEQYVGSCWCRLTMTANVVNRVFESVGFQCLEVDEPHRFIFPANTRAPSPSIPALPMPGMLR
jgi:predicted component of type VI protein secretion system